MISITIKHEKIMDVANALDYIPVVVRREGIALGLNRLGARVNTAIKRSISNTLGIPQKIVAAHLTQTLANPASLRYVITGSGGRLSLPTYKGVEAPRRHPVGVSARIYKRRIMHVGAFQILRWGGKSYRRKGHSRFPIEQVKGPSPGIEMMLPPTADIPILMVGELLLPQLLSGVRSAISLAKRKYRV